MKIAGLDTIRIAERPNLIWLQVHTDQGINGLGRIGREIADRLATFKMEVHSQSRTPKDVSKRPDLSRRSFRNGHGRR